MERYGSEANTILELVRQDPALAEPVAPGMDVTAAEFAFAIQHEGALDEGDLLDRRTRIGLVDTDRKAARPAAERALS